MTKEIARQLINCMLDPDANISPHIPPSMAESAGIKISYDNSLRKEARSISFEGEASFKHAEQLAQGFSKSDKITPSAGKEALQYFDSYISSSPDNSYNAGVKAP